jgi:hypothetical protein
MELCFAPVASWTAAGSAAPRRLAYARRLSFVRKLPLCPKAVLKPPRSHYAAKTMRCSPFLQSSIFHLLQLRLGRAGFIRVYPWFQINFGKVLFRAIGPGINPPCTI